MNRRRFPVHSVHRHLLANVPWDLIAQHEPQAISNHDQDLSALARRGGLDLAEILAVIENRPYRVVPVFDAVELVKRHIREFANRGAKRLRAAAIDDGRRVY